MLTKRVIARLDVKPSIGCLKGKAYEGLRRVGDAAALAAQYEDQGADEILLLDTTASLYGRLPDLDFLRGIAQALYIPLTYGGGVRSVEAVRAILKTGVEKVALCTHASQGLLETISRAFGAQAVVWSLQFRKEAQKGGWVAYTLCGREPRPAVDWSWAEWCGEVLLTAVDRDGTLRGLDHALLAAIKPLVSVPVVLSGGASDPVDVVKAFEGGASGVAIGAALHAGLSIKEIKAVMCESGVEVRV